MHVLEVFGILTASVAPSPDTVFVFSLLVTGVCLYLGPPSLLSGFRTFGFLSSRSPFTRNTRGLKEVGLAC